MILSASTIFLSAFLLFQIQPMIAKMILPWFGGSAAVWITAMLFFQTALLGGYLYAHWSVRSLGPRSQALLHAGLLGASLLLLPVTPSLAWKPSGSEEPIMRILGLLTVSLGLPYVLLSTTSPIIQAWYARRNMSALPYRFFALSNFASLLGLLAYPFLVEPNVTLRQQSLGWSAAYGVFVLLCGIAAITYGRNTSPDGTATVDGIDEKAASKPPRAREQFFWMVLAACASTFLLSVTNHLTQNVASIPFLWVLPGYFELAIALMACAVLMLTVIDHRAWRVTVVVGWAVAVAVTVSSYMYVSSYQESVRAMVRNFYGGLRVTEFDEGTEDEARTMVHGTVIHGKQFMALERHRERITYYAPGSGVGLAVKALRRSPLRVGVIGLGAGSLAAYAEAGDVFRFYEINPLVEKLARSEFTYLSDSRGRTEVVLGDGRLSLEREGGQRYDLLVVDAFSGDSIPAHLLTTQALELYFRHLRPTGILALHITNTHLDLAPVVDSLTRKLGKHAVMITNDRDEDREIYTATWALLSSKPLTSPAVQEAAEELPHRPELRPWTDDYNNLFQILK
jgi:hypothetical protein